MTAEWVLATNQEARRASFLERKLRSVLPIDGTAFSGALGAVKSSPVFYPAAEPWLDIERRGQEVVFVDDWPYNFLPSVRSRPLWIQEHAVHIEGEHRPFRGICRGLDGYHLRSTTARVSYLMTVRTTGSRTTRPVPRRRVGTPLRHRWDASCRPIVRP